MTSDTIHDTRYSWFRLAITLLIGTVGNAGMWSIVVVMPAVQSEFGIDRSEGSLLYAVTMAGFAFGSYFIGRAVDRHGIFISLNCAAVTIAAGFLGVAFSTSFWSIAFFQFILGFGGAAGFAPLLADISHWFSKHRGLAVGIAASGNYLSGTIWPLIITAIMADYSWRVSYGFVAVATLVIIIPLTFLIRRRADRADDKPAKTDSTSRSIRLSPRELQFLLCVAGFSCCMAMAMPQVHIVSMCVDLSYGAVVGAEMLSLMLLGGVAARLISGMVVDRIGGVKTLLIGSVLQTIALALYLPSDGLKSLYLVSLIFGLAQGGIVPSYAVIIREYLPAKEAGARVGFVIMATVVGMAVGGWMSGAIYDLTGSYQMAFLNGIAWNLLNIAIMIYIFFSARSPKIGRVVATA